MPGTITWTGEPTGDWHTLAFTLSFLVLVVALGVYALTKVRR